MWLRRKTKFIDIAREVLDTKRVKAKGTYSDANLYLNRLNSYFGNRPICTITETDWGRYVQHCKDENTRRKLHGDQKYMRQVIFTAFRKELIKRPIVLAIPDPKHSDVGREITDAELGRLFALANAELRFQMEIALKTGFRLREMLYLRWDRFDWHEKLVRLRPTDTKTRKGRAVPLPLELLEEFQRRFHRTKSPFVFPSRFDVTKPQHENKSAWQRCRATARVTARWHDFRHTCATRLLRKGIPVSIAKDYLGMTEKVLVRIYQHLNLNDLRRAADAMSEEWKVKK